MEWLWLVAVAVVVGWVLWHRKAVKIAQRHARTLSSRTGLPAETIYRQMRERNLTPGEWAAAQGLNPLTFRPVAPPTPPQASGLPRQDLTRWFLDRYRMAVGRPEVRAQLARPDSDLAAGYRQVHVDTARAVAEAAEDRFGPGAMVALLDDTDLQQAAVALLPRVAPGADEIIEQLSNAVLMATLSTRGELLGDPDADPQTIADSLVRAYADGAAEIASGRPSGAANPTEKLPQLHELLWAHAAQEATEKFGWNAVRPWTVDQRTTDRMPDVLVSLLDVDEVTASGLREHVEVERRRLTAD